MKKLIVLLALSAVSPMVWADAFYCTENNQYISPGMSMDDVEQACGAPDSTQKTQQSVTKQVPVQQLTFNIATSTFGNYQGTVTPGIQSSNIQINTGQLTTVVVESSNNRITSISVNGTSAQSLSMCGGGTFGVGDPPSMAVNSCGNPVAENDTYKNVSTGQEEPVEIWSYIPTDYQPPFQLIFVNGQLKQVDTSGGGQ